MVRIPVKTPIIVDDVTDKTKVTLPVADRHTVDGSGFGSAKSATTEQLEWILDYQIVDAPAHGCTAADIGKPMTATPTMTILDDTLTTHWPVWILVGIPTPGALRVALPGARVRLSKDLLATGFDPSVTRRAWWDLSDAKYEATRPADSAGGMCSCLTVLSVGSTTFDAIVNPLVTNMRPLVEKTLSQGDVDAKYTTIVGENLAHSVQVWVGGVAVSTEDATFSSEFGTLGWNGLGLDGQAAAGLRVTGFWEPKL